MAYSAMAVANGFVKRAKEGRLADLSPMKLQKLLFFAQSWHLALKDKTPLVDDFFARWKHGPVVPSLYHEFKEYGSSAIQDFGGHLIRRDGELVKVRPIVPDSDEDAWALMDRIIDVYGRFNGAQLSAMTHQEGTAWRETGPADGGVMSNEELVKYIQPVKVATAA
jgi:uncharacterized phage-associated protein